MKIDILTIFPEMFVPLKESVLKRAMDKGIFELNIVNLRDYSLDKHKKTDDYTFGGGAGMIMTPQPIFDAITTLDPSHTARRVFMSPCGQCFSQNKSVEFSKYEHLIFLCGHYEGVDQRVIDLLIDEEMSIGDYILTGGELPAMVIVDSLCRNLDGVLKNDSLCSESFNGDLLEYPQYTRPQVFQGLQVPEILVGGDHAKVDKWRIEQSLERTKKNRPDLYEKYLKNQNK